MIRGLPLFLALLLACAPHLRAGPSSSPLVGTPLSLTVHALEGGAVHLGGPGPVRVLDVFASWCEPCRAQLPALERLAEARRARGLEVAAVSVDEERTALERFRDQVPVSLPIYFDQAGGVVTPALRVQRLPMTFLVDRAGVIRHVHLGFNARAEAELAAQVDALLAEPVPRSAERVRVPGT